MASHHHDADQTYLGATLRAILGRFEGRSLDDALTTEMTTALNQALASLLDGRRIEVALDGSSIRAGVSPGTAAGGDAGE